MKMTSLSFHKQTTKLSGMETQAEDFSQKAEQASDEKTKTKYTALARACDWEAERFRLKYDIRAEDEEK